MAATPYDQYYQTENLFGAPYPELIAFFTAYPNKGKVLDLGCGQGRDAIALARIGYTVIGIDSAAVGIEQMNQIAKAEGLNSVGQVGDIYSIADFGAFDIVLLDSMLHFAKKDREKEVGLVQKIVATIKTGGLLAVCIQDTGDKVRILKQAIDYAGPLSRLADEKFRYTFEDEASGHRSETAYRMIVVEK